MRRKKGDKGLVGIKIDINWAFDMIEWDVLNSLLRKYGFFPGPSL